MIIPIAALFMQYGSAFSASVQTPLSTLKLIKNTPDARAGTLQIAQTELGFFIRGSVLGPAPQWPDSVDEIASKDHIEVWIADAQDVALPPIGWGHQFGYEYLANEDSCSHNKYPDLPRTKEEQDDCRQWYHRQIDYRKKFSKLFVRQWQMAPHLIREVYAQPAFQSLTQDTQKKLSVLQPTLDSHIAFSVYRSQNSAYNFEVLIPWGALPPMQTLELKKLRILVDVFSANQNSKKYGPFSTIAEHRQYANSRSFYLLTLQQPRSYFLTACHYSL